MEKSMSDPILRYHRLTPLEPSTPDAHPELWQLSSDSMPTPPLDVNPKEIEEISEWAWRDIRFYRSTDSSSTWVGIPSEMNLNTAREIIAERLGRVEIVEEAEKDYSQMSDSELKKEMDRLSLRGFSEQFLLVLEPGQPKAEYETDLLLPKIAALQKEINKRKAEAKPWWRKWLG